MRSQGQIFLGLALVLLGLFYLFGVVFHVDVGALCFPIFLILLGAWLLIRPRTAGPGVKTTFAPLADLDRRGAWPVTREEIWTLVGDVKLDFTSVQLPAGETRINIYGFVAGIHLYVPPDVAVAVTSNAFVVDAKLAGSKQTSFLSPIVWTSSNYASAERRVHVETLFFVTDLSVEQLAARPAP